jgi:ATP-dependent RNA helicase DeaD
VPWLVHGIHGSREQVAGRRLYHELSTKSQLILDFQEYYKMTISFHDLDLSKELLRALDDLGFVNASPIQEKAIPLVLEGRDVIALAKTGTGKTAAFVVPLLQRLNKKQKTPQALIFAPTRELAMQIHEHICSLTRYMDDVQATVICGGQDYKPQLKNLRAGPQIVVGTPGRILDHVERGTLNLAEMTTFVLDEADEMLRMGFIEEVEKVLSRLPAVRQLVLCSATMPSRIRQIANSYLKDPAMVEIRSETATVESIEQKFIFATGSQKNDILLRLLAVEDTQGVIVFVKTKSSTEDVAKVLIERGYRAMAIHGDITQNLRERIIAQFKQGSIDVLVATDVAARGLDVERVTHVINYDMVHDCETYVHRIGRTGRAGRSGIAILFVTPKESRMLSMIERHTRQKIEKISPPADDLINAARENQLIAKINTRLSNPNLADYKEIIQRYLSVNPEVDVVDVASILALLLHQDKPWQQNLPKIFTPKLTQESDRSFSANRSGSRNNNSRGKFNAQDAGRRSSDRGSRASSNSVDQKIFRLDVGKVHGVKPSNIVGAIANEAGLDSRFITGLKIHEDHSVVCLPRNMDKNTIQGLNKAWVCGRQLKLTELGVA